MTVPITDDYAVGIRTKSDSNGNSRRGWLIYSRTGELLAFMDAAGRGDSILRRTYPDVTALCMLQVTPAEWQAAKRNRDIEQL
jgi:hypothetical protein